MTSRNLYGLAIAILMLLPIPSQAQTLQPGFTIKPQRDSSGNLLRFGNREIQYGRPEVDIFATGAVRDAASGKNTPANVSGSLGLRYRGARFVVAGLINVASKEDTIRADYGATLLPPSSGRGLNAGLLDVRAPRLVKDALCVDRDTWIPCHIGVHLYFTASSARWATAFNTTGQATATQIVPSWGSGAGFSYTFINGELEDSNKVAMVLDVGVATRSIRGDISANDAARSALLGTTSRNFVGGEFSLNMQYNMVLAGITYYYMSGSLSGFSRGQVVAGVSLQSNLNSKALKK